jgi:hypothetical protein
MTTLAPAAVVSTTPEVVGKAIYLEATPVLDAEGKPVIPWYGGKDSVKQIIIFPRGKDATGRNVEPYIFDRIVSATYPKAQWNRNQIHPTPSKAEFAANGETNYRGLVLEAPTPAELEAMPEEIQKQFYANGIELRLYQELMYAKSIHNPETGNYDVVSEHAWKVVRKFAVEITDKDLSDIYNYKTPQAVIRRATKVRVSLGLPEKLF